MHNNRRHESKTTSRLDEAPVGIEITVGADRSFCKLLPEAIDEALYSLGESVRTAIYFHLENAFGIRRHEIPYRIDDFSDALEKIFGLGARSLEIMFMKHLRNRIGLVCKWDLPKWVVPDLTFKQYVLLMKQNFE